MNWGLEGFPGLGGGGCLEERACMRKVYTPLGVYGTKSRISEVESTYAVSLLGL